MPDGTRREGPPPANRHGPAAAVRRRLGFAAAALLLLAAAAPRPAPAGPIEGAPPYPPSARVADLSLDWSSHRALAAGSDNWAMTPVGGGQLYGTWGDGSGLNASGSDAYVSIGLARLTGSTAGSLRGENLLGGLAPRLAPCFPALGGPVDNRRFQTGSFPCRGRGLHGKSYSLIALGSRLHMFVSPGSGRSVYDEARLYRAAVGSASFARASWAFTRGASPPLLHPAFAQGGGGDGFVYAYATRYAPVAGGAGLHRGEGGGEIHLLRAPRTADLLQRGAWEFFSGTPSRPSWSRSQAASRPVFVDRAGVGWVSSAIRVDGLGRVLLTTEHGRGQSSRFGVFEAPDYWGPWGTVAYFTLRGAGPRRNVGDAFYAAFLPNSFSSDGSRFTFQFSGVSATDALNVVDGRFTLRGG